MNMSTSARDKLPATNLQHKRKKIKTSQPKLIRHQVPDLNPKAKYVALKRQVRSLVLENAALCDLTSETQRRLLSAQEERAALLQRLLRLEQASAAAAAAAAPAAALARRQSQPRPAAASSAESTAPRLSWSASAGAQLGSNSGEAASSALPPTLLQPSPLQQPLSVQQQSLQLPLQLGSLTLQATGRLLPDRPAYHTISSLYPAGYVSLRRQVSLVAPGKLCQYRCSVDDAGRTPRFTVTACDAGGVSVTGASADQCHRQLLQLMASSLYPEIHEVVPVSGDAFFGLSHPRVRQLLQALPGAERCGRYRPLVADVVAEERGPVVSAAALRQKIAARRQHRRTSGENE